MSRSNLFLEARLFGSITEMRMTAGAHVMLLPILSLLAVLFAPVSITVDACFDDSPTLATKPVDWKVKRGKTHKGDLDTSKSHEIEVTEGNCATVEYKIGARWHGPFDLCMGSGSSSHDIPKGASEYRVRVSGTGDPGYSKGTLTAN